MPKQASQHKITYVPFGGGDAQSIPLTGKTETKAIALQHIKDGHSNVVIHTQSPMGEFYGDAELNRTVIDAHRARMSRSLAPYIALRRLATVVDSLASAAKSKDLSEEQKASLMQAFVEVLPALGVALPPIAAAMTHLDLSDIVPSTMTPIVGAMDLNDFLSLPDTGDDLSDTLEPLFVSPSLPETSQEPASVEPIIPEILPESVNEETPIAEFNSVDQPEKRTRSFLRKG
jgi:hypothetical protein